MTPAIRLAITVRRSLRGNVDRNEEDENHNKTKLVVPYVGTWIEIRNVIELHKDRTCRSLRGNVDRNFPL